MVSYKGLNTNYESKSEKVVIYINGKCIIYCILVI